ncbi:MAG: response regulator transcription factor [Crocinitomicaceae bacterium]|nr:response regulator transcription factor [Crocinitomicaceae bacterium]
MSYSILVADHQNLFRECLVELLKYRKPDLKILEAQTGTETLFVLSQFKPTILIINLGLPELNGFHIIKKLNKYHSETKVILLHNYVTREIIQISKKIGATAFVSKKAGLEMLFNTIAQVEVSNEFVCLEWFENKNIKTSLNTSCLEDLVFTIEDLSKNERNVLKLFCQGFSTKEVAELLHIKTKSVDNYKNRIGRKINISPDEYFLDWLRKNHEQLKLVV